MSPRPVAVPSSLPQPINPRIDVALGARQLSGALANEANRVAAHLGRTWTTPENVEQAKAELLRIAEDALELRRMLCS